MKFVLLITACSKYINRFNLQIKNLDKNSHFINKHHITPLFVFGEDDAELPPQCKYKQIRVKTGERYTNLYKKIILGFEESLKLDFDYLIKIDDDTLVNFQHFESQIFSTYDYIGRIQNFFTKNTINIDLPMYNIHKQVDLYPSSFEENFKFATGDFYALSRKWLEYIIHQKQYVFDTFKEEDYICEDQLIGFLLKDQPLAINDIISNDRETFDLKLQLTKNNLSVHPINCQLFEQMINMDSKKQLFFLKTNRMLNLYYRESLLDNLQKSIKKLILDFANSSKLMGIG